MIEFFTYPSTNTLKVAILLEECGLPYRVRTVCDESGTPEPDFQQASPTGTVPAIRDTENGASLFESGAILLYLADKAEQFLPSHPLTRAEATQWLIFESANLGPAAGELYHYECYAPETLPYAVQRYQDRIRTLYGLLDRRLAGRPYLAGDYSVADMANFPWTTVLDELAGLELSEFPNLKRWSDTIAARPAVQRAIRL